MIPLVLLCKISWAEATLWRKKEWSWREKKKEVWHKWSMSQQRTQLDHILTNKEKLVEDLRARGSLGCSDHEMMKFRILQGGNKAKRRFTTLDFRRTGFHLLMDLLGRITWNMMLREEDTRRAVWFSRISFSRFHNSPVWCVGSQAMLAVGLHGWTRRFWQNPNIKKVADQGWKKGVGDSGGT